MDWFAGEPTLDETLSDPVVQAVMKRDDVDLDGLRRFLEDIGGRLGDSTERDAYLRAERAEAA